MRYTKPLVRPVEPPSYTKLFGRLFVYFLCTVVQINAFRRYISGADTWKCSGLMNDGHWSLSPHRESDSISAAQWQPPGCLLRSYNATEIARCHGDGKIVFVGDSVVRQIFWATARKIEGDSNWVFEQRAKRETHGNIEFEMNGARLHFLWDPWLNSSALHKELGAFRQRRDCEDMELEEMDVQRSAVMLIGGGISHARHDGLAAVDHFKDSIDAVVARAYGDSSPADIRKFPGKSVDGIGDEIFFTPVIQPIYDRLSPARETSITPDKVDSMNKYLQEQYTSQRLNIFWSYANMTNGQPERYQESGLHVIESVANEMADVLLNYRCNAKAAQTEGYPFDRTCCSAYEQPTWAQLGIFVIACSGLGFMLIEFLRLLLARPYVPTRRRLQLQHKDVSGQPDSEDGECPISQNSDRLYSSAMRYSYHGSLSYRMRLRAAVLTIFLVLYYSWSADRSQTFEKERKLFSSIDFNLMFGLSSVVCLLSIRAVPRSQYWRLNQLKERENKTLERERAWDDVDAVLSEIEKEWDDLETELFELRQKLGNPANLGNDLLLTQAQRLQDKCLEWEKQLFFIKLLLNNGGFDAKDGAASPAFLPRAQTDEIKGWVQIFLLAYNYTGGEQSLTLYECHRIAIAFYLFLHGYGHATYLLGGGDSSPRRVLAVLFRINILAILLSCMMNRPYASYYFAPLVGFWTLVVYYTFKPTARSNGSLGHLCQRVALSVLLIASFIHIPGLLDGSLLILTSVFRVRLDVKAWRHHLRTDAYIVFIGMLVAILHRRILNIRSTSLGRLSGPSRFLRKHFRAVQYLAVGLALVVLPGFWNLTRRSPNKADYDWWMPYIAWLPVLAIVLLRNSTRFLRTHYCAAFAWLGRSSLELYLLSQHVWMAGDGHGRLRVFSGERGSLGGMWSDLVVLSPLLVGLAWCVRDGTAVIVEWLLELDISGVMV